MDRGRGAVGRDPHGQSVAIERGVVRPSPRSRRQDLVGDLVAPEQQQASPQRGQINPLEGGGSSGSAAAAAAVVVVASI